MLGHIDKLDTWFNAHFEKFWKWQKYLEVLAFYQKSEKNMDIRPDFDFDILW